MKKRLLCALLSIFVVFSVLPCFSAVAMTILSSYSATINGVKVTKDSYPGQNNCWKYANGIYKKIWGCYFTSEFTGKKETDYNMLREMTAENRKISLTTVKKYVSAAPLGAVIRVCRTNSTAYSDGSDGHSLILAGKSDKGYYFFEDWGAGNSGYDNVATFYTFSEFAEYFPSSKKYYYFKYIKWPNATSFSFDYYVKYNANGGKNAPTKQGKEKNSNITLSQSVPTRDGYAFTGWATTADATAVQYYANSSYSENKSQTLYAVWKAAANFGTKFYAKIRNASLSRYLTTQSDDNVASYAINNKNSQIWYFVKSDDGSYKLTNRSNGNNLSITYAVSTVGGNVKSYYLSDSPAQNWYFVKTGSNYAMYSQCTDKALSIADSATKNGTNIETAVFTSGKNQLFSIMKDITSPVISDISVSKVSYQSFKIRGKITDNKELKSAQICTYTEENGDDDAITSALSVQDNGSFSYTVKRAEHKYDYGEYCFKITAYDSAWNNSSYFSKAEIPSAYTPKSTVKAGTHFYSVYDISLSFEKAKAYAQSLGGHLAAIGDKTEQAAVQNAISSVGKKNYYWIGLYDENMDNKFAWVNGDGISYRNWAKGEPSTKTEQYGFMYANAYSSAKSGQWADISNYAGSPTGGYYITKFGFVVEFDSVPAPMLGTTKIEESGIKLSFSNSPIATSYQVYRRQDTDSAYTKIADVSVENGQSYLDTRVKNGKTYFYSLKAVRETVCGTDYSNIRTGTFVKKVNFKSALKYASRKVILKWAKSTGADGYKIYRKASGGKYKLIKTLSATAVSFVNSGLKKGTKYYYKIRAYKNALGTVKYGVYSVQRSVTAK